MGETTAWRGARAVEWAGFENQYVLMGIGGSNPPLSAILLIRAFDEARDGAQNGNDEEQRAPSGEVSEWLKEHAWKACVSHSRHRGFESLPLRHHAATEERELKWSANAAVGSVRRYGSRSNRVRPGTEQP